MLNHGMSALACPIYSGGRLFIAFWNFRGLLECANMEGEPMPDALHPDAGEGC